MVYDDRLRLDLHYLLRLVSVVNVDCVDVLLDFLRAFVVLSRIVLAPVYSLDWKIEVHFVESRLPHD